MVRGARIAPAVGRGVRLREAPAVSDRNDGRYHLIRLNCYMELDTTLQPVKAEKDCRFLGGSRLRGRGEYGENELPSSLSFTGSLRRRGETRAEARLRRRVSCAYGLRPFELLRRGLAFWGEGPTGGIEPGILGSMGVREGHLDRRLGACGVWHEGARVATHLPGNISP